MDRRDDQPPRRPANYDDQLRQPFIPPLARRPDGQPVQLPQRMIVVRPGVAGIQPPPQPNVRRPEVIILDHHVPNNREGMLRRRAQLIAGQIRAQAADSPRASKTDRSEPFKRKTFKRSKVSSEDDSNQDRNRKRKEKLFTDISIQIGDKLHDAHRIILTSKSPFFEALVSDNWLENKVCQLNPEFVDPDIGEALLDYIYTDKIELTSENARKFCIAAHYLQMAELLSKCELILIESVSAENAMEEFKFGHFWGLLSLMTKCITEIPKLQEESRESMLNSFEKGEILRLLDCVNEKVNPKYDGLTALKEFIYHCAVSWAKEKPEDRKDQLPEVLEKIPLKDLSLPFYRDVVCNEALIRQSTEGSNALVNESQRRLSTN